MVIFVSLVPERRHMSKSSIIYVLPIATTLESYAHCSRCLARLSGRNRPTLMVPDSRPLLGANIPVVSVSMHPVT